MYGAQMIEALSWLVVMEENRIPLFRNTLKKYVEFGAPFPVQIIIATRSMSAESYNKLCGEFPIFDWTMTRYVMTGKYFAPATGFNEAMKLAKHQDIFVSFPEVWPVSDVWNQIKLLERGTYMFRVDDLREDGTIFNNIIRKGYRDQTPAYYFMALYKKEHILAINGWDEDYTDGYWYDDDEFGLRMFRYLERVGEKHQTINDIYGQHQWHSRGHYTQEGIEINKQKFFKLQQNKVIKCLNGIEKL